MALIIILIISNCGCLEEDNDKKNEKENIEVLKLTVLLEKDILRLKMDVNNNTKNNCINVTIELKNIDEESIKILPLLNGLTYRGDVYNSKSEKIYTFTPIINIDNWLKEDIILTLQPDQTITDQVRIIGGVISNGINWSGGIDIPGNYTLHVKYWSTYNSTNINKQFWKGELYAEPQSFIAI